MNSKFKNDISLLSYFCYKFRILFFFWGFTWRIMVIPIQMVVAVQSGTLTFLVFSWIFLKLSRYLSGISINRKSNLWNLVCLQRPDQLSCSFMIVKHIPVYVIMVCELVYKTIATVLVSLICTGCLSLISLCQVSTWNTDCKYSFFSLVDLLKIFFFRNNVQIDYVDRKKNIMNETL